MSEILRSVIGRTVAEAIRKTISPKNDSDVWARGYSRSVSVLIFTINVDGTQKRQVSTGDGMHVCPAWSFDGKRIAYQALSRDKVSGKSDAIIRLVNADGSGDVAVGTHLRPSLDEMPSWLPDGKRLAIQSNRDGTMRIYLIDLNGEELRRVVP